MAMGPHHPRCFRMVQLATKLSGKDGKNQIVLMVNGQNNLVLGVMENGEPHALYNSSRRAADLVAGQLAIGDPITCHLAGQNGRRTGAVPGRFFLRRLVPAPPG